MYENVVHHTKTAGTDRDPLRSGGLIGAPIGAPAGAGIRARGLGKRFDDLWAVRDLDLVVEPGAVLGLLGHNGAGKTTTIRMLTTLSPPTAGSALVAGHDVVSAGSAVRASIGVVGQQATVDDLLTGRANLVMIGRLSGLDRSSARRRADELLEQLELTDAADRIAKTYSGGMRRRLDLAAGLVAEPSVLFLDEPTTGLDPRSRTQVWDLLRERVAGGTTLLLTTQYLEEADRLADEVMVMDHGRAVASGTPSELKARLAGDRVEVTVARADQVEAAASVLASVTGAPTTTTPSPSSGTGSSDNGSSGPGGASVIGGIGADLRLVDVLRALDAQGIDVADVARLRPTLDDVFLALTSHDTPQGVTT